MKRAPSWQAELALRLLLPAVAIACAALIAAALLVLLRPAPGGPAALSAGDLPRATPRTAIAERPPGNPDGPGRPLSAGWIPSPAR